ncbi:MAG TPA: hypothetical protein VL977_06470 [Solirubrobacteraceae bacterium]|nr:hypothetical protein [Solirubrobacteraceae bacterium]
MRLTPRGRIKPLRALALAGVVAAIGAGAAYAAGASPFVGSTGAISSCLPPKGGQVHVWKPGHACSGGWVALSWAASGATGPTGATGAPNPAAQTVDGQALEKVMTRIPTPASGSSTATLYASNGLTLTAACSNTGSASLTASGPGSGDAELTVSGYGGAGAFGSQTATLGSAGDATVGPAGSGETTFSFANSSGTLVNGQLGYQSASSFSTYAGCSFFGELTAG